MKSVRLFRWSALALALLVLALVLLAPPIDPRRPLAQTIYSQDGQLLSAHTSSDGQWHFSPVEAIPDNYRKALIAFEDRRFYYHPGLDPLSMVRALFQNIRSGTRVSGASTLTMQLARISRNSPERSFFNKGIEICMALRHELCHSKDDILASYAAHAPFGGNVIGLEAATWRYLGKSPASLSWAEAAMLAVLPNAPGLIHPGRNRDALRRKRDRLLQLLADEGTISSEQLELALAEPIPGQNYDLPALAPELLSTLSLSGLVGQTGTGIDAGLQQSVRDLLVRHYRVLSTKAIHNAAVLIIDHLEQRVIAYAGNIPGIGRMHSPFIDIIQAPRSTGSILKPILVMEALETGQLTPKSWEKDIPCWISGYHPENYHKDHDGLVSIEQALIRSLNVPMVFTLQRMGVDRFLNRLRSMGLSTLDQPADHYGLTLITGGGEATLWDVTQAYAALSRKAHGLPSTDQSAIDPRGSLQKQIRTDWLSPGAAWSVLQMMQQLERPGISQQWKQFTGAPRLSWKTGTSYGFRDAWAVGTNDRYTVGVWVGNADGEGRPGIIGVEAAAPILLDVFRLLPAAQYYEPPYATLDYLGVCRESGFLPGECCEIDTILAPVSCARAPMCRFHTQIRVDKASGLRATHDCSDQLIGLCVLHIPPVEAQYWKSPGQPVPVLPAWSPACRNFHEQVMVWKYPKHGSRFFIPSSGNPGGQEVVFDLAHLHPEKVVHWYLDGSYLGATTDEHQLPFNAPPGEHRMLVVDEDGNELPLSFTILGQGTGE